MNPAAWRKTNGHQAYGRGRVTGMSRNFPCTITGRVTFWSSDGVVARPASWVGLLTLVVLEIVLGIDNLIFIAILADKLPPRNATARA